MLTICSLVLVMVLCISEVRITCSQERSCSSQQCSFSHDVMVNVNVNNGDVLQTIIESMVNQSLNEKLPASVEEAVENKFQAVQQQINDTIDEKIVDSHHDTPGKEFKTIIHIILLLYAAYRPIAIPALHCGTL